jgi:hypothetical protein
MAINGCPANACVFGDCTDGGAGRAQASMEFDGALGNSQTRLLFRLGAFLHSVGALFEAEASLLMGYIQGEGRNKGTLFPIVLDDFVPADHMCRVIGAFVEKLVMSELGFERAQAAETGRPGYDPRDLLKLYLYGYLNQLLSSRCLEAECRRNVELINSSLRSQPPCVIYVGSLTLP